MFSNNKNNPPKPQAPVDILPNIIEDIKLSENLFKEDRILEAFHLLNNIEKFTQGQESQHIQTVVTRTIASSPLTANIRRSGEHIMSLLQLINDPEPWNVWNTGIGLNQDVTVSTHKNEEKGQYYFKIEGTLRCDIIYAVAAILENDLYQFWMPLCTHSEVVSIPSIHRRVIRTQFDFTLLKKEALYDV